MTCGFEGGHRCTTNANNTRTEANDTQRGRDATCCGSNSPPCVTRSDLLIAGSPDRSDRGTELCHSAAPPRKRQRPEQIRRGPTGPATGGGKPRAPQLRCALSQPRWRKSPYSEDSGNACVEIAETGPLIAIRDSKEPSPPLHHGQPGGLDELHRSPQTPCAPAVTSRPGQPDTDLAADR
ncbi:DUF397 domain-containing protein [Streptomyces sp. YIM S03343]